MQSQSQSLFLRSVSGATRIEVPSASVKASSAPSPVRSRLPLVIVAESVSETNARDCGANMVLVKPVSPSSLYDRLVWIAFNARKFVDSKDYFGPDRRFKIEGYPNGVGRRSGDKAVDLGTPTGPALSQSDIDALLKASRNG